MGGGRSLGGEDGGEASSFAHTTEMVGLKKGEAKRGKGKKRQGHTCATRRGMVSCHELRGGSLSKWGGEKEHQKVRSIQED